MQFFLQKHTTTTDHHSIKVSLTRQGRQIIINFSVQKRDGTPWLSESSFTEDWTKNWGLWNHDVVEAFLQLRKDAEDLQAPYLEVQVSPLNQPFALVIKEPRKIYFPPDQLNLKTESIIEGHLWMARLELELPQDIQGEMLYGGAFACLSQNPREFFALRPNPEDNPDFHRPELFIYLDET